MSKKNRYKHLRTITVNGKDYKWLVEKIDDGNLIKIWDNSKQLVLQKIEKSYLTIYPKMVRLIIEGK